MLHRQIEDVLTCQKAKVGNFDNLVTVIVLTDYLETSDCLRTKILCLSDFINKELILFSRADNIRSIPCSVDGFKPGQRKILFSCFKRNLKSEIKVAQLAGYVSEHSAYHHGEVSLCQTIVNMAQNFVGSNNLNLLESFYR